MAVLKEKYPISCHSDTYRNRFLGLLIGQLISACLPGFATLKSRNAVYELLILRFYIYMNVKIMVFWNVTSQKTIIVRNALTYELSYAHS
jgi:hypothetical protein